MTVYVDDMGMRARVGQRNARWSHLIADSREELHAFAASIGLKREWFQDPLVNTKAAKIGLLPKPGTYMAESWHYDVTESKRQAAIKAGAVPIRWLDTPNVIRARIEAQRGQAGGQA